MISYDAFQALFIKRYRHFFFQIRPKVLDIAILMIFCCDELYRNITVALQGDEVLREVEEE